MTCFGFKFDGKLGERIVGLRLEPRVAVDDVAAEDCTVWNRRETHRAGCIGISAVCCIDKGQIWYEAPNSVNLESGG